jgi:hypothetical protein
LIGLFIVDPSSLFHPSHNNGIESEQNNETFAITDLIHADNTATATKALATNINMVGVEEYTMFGANDTLANQTIGLLENVNLQSLSAVTDDVIIQVCLCGKQTLKRLNIHGCHQVTSRSIAAVIMHCSERLEQLNVAFARKFSEDSLGVLVQKSTLLESITLWGCTQLTTRFYNSVKPTVQVIGRPTWI